MGKWKLLCYALFQFPTTLLRDTSEAASSQMMNNGRFSFNDRTAGDILENYCQDDHLMNVARLLFCLTILLTGPIECFVARDLIINTLLKRSEYRDPQPTSEMNLQRVLVTSVIVTATCIVSFTTDCLAIVLEFNVSGPLSIITSDLSVALPCTDRDVVYRDRDRRMAQRSWNAPSSDAKRYKMLNSIFYFLLYIVV